MVESLSGKDWMLIGEWANDELNRRKQARKGEEAIWAEIDRQLSMSPRPQEVKSGEAKDWFADLELPLQFNALEVNAADARRLKFPRGTEWYSVCSNVSQKYEERFAKRRKANPILPDKDGVQVKLDQETADILVKSVMDYFHRQYDFRGQIDLFDAEALKYGTAVARVRPVSATNLGYDFRGVTNENLMGPAVLTGSIKSTYLDDTPPQVMQEGISSSPTVMRVFKQRLEALKAAGAKGGADRGWIGAQINKLEPVKHADNRADFVNLIELEGDVIVPRSRGSIFLPNVLMTIAVDHGRPRGVRFRLNPTPFRSHVVGHYMRTAVDSPYGTSPLMKGQPVQEAATGVFNGMLSVGAWNANPPSVWDRNDPNMAALGGPLLYPGAVLGVDAPDAVNLLELKSLGELTTIYLALLKQYEDLTGNTEQRRGAAVSHRTAQGDAISASQGVSRTDDFVTSMEQGPLTTMLFMEYAIIKKFMTTSVAVPVNAGGIEGFVNVAAADLPDEVSFTVQGSSGATSEREKLQTLVQTIQLSIQLAQVAVSLGQPVPLNVQEMLVELWNESGFPNAGRFVGGTQDIPAGSQANAPLSGAGNGAAAVGASPLETAPGA